MRDFNKELNLRLNTWFSLTVRQRNILQDNEIGHYNLCDVDMELIKRVTKNKKILENVTTLKRMTLRLAS